MSKRLNQEREKELTPKRFEYAISQLEKRGYKLFNVSETSLQFTHDGSIILLFPYSGWHTGKSIQDGRGLKNLLKQLQ